MCGSGGGCEQRGWLVADSETDGCLKLDRARCAQRSSDKPEVARHVVRCGIQVCRLREDMAVRDVERISANLEIYRLMVTVVLLTAAPLGSVIALLTDTRLSLGLCKRTG